MTIRTVTVAEARSEFSTLLAQVELLNQRVVISRRGRPKAALVSVTDLERLEALDQGAGAATRTEAVIKVMQQAGLLRPLSPDLVEAHVRMTPEERAEAARRLAERRFTPSLSAQILADRRQPDEGDAAYDMPGAPAGE